MLVVFECLLMYVCAHLNMCVCISEEEKCTSSAGGGGAGGGWLWRISQKLKAGIQEERTCVCVCLHVCGTERGLFTRVLGWGSNPPCLHH